jgi:L-glyceraldehyde 3-phosphate reductase
MWPGPYGDFGSRKYLIASLDQSLERLVVDYVDIFYHHRPDEETPLEETIAALDYAVRSGRALYVGISSYSAERTRQAAKILRDLGTPCIIHEPSYNMFNRKIEENGLLDALSEEGIGCIAFCPLAQGLLTNKYLDGIPSGSRASKSHGFLKSDNITEEKLATVRALNELANERGQSLAQMALRWVLRHETMTTALIGASRPEQIDENVACLQASAFSDGELQRIESILAE